MKSRFLHLCLTVLTVTALSSTAAEAGFWKRIFERREAKKAVEAVESEGTTLTTENAIAMAASVKSALASVTANADQLRTLLGDRPELQSALEKTLAAVAKGDDLLAIDQFKQISEASSLTAEQRRLVGELKKDFEVLALGRNFPENGPVSSAISQIKEGDYSKALITLGEVAKDGNLTETQRSVLNAVIGQHAGSLRSLLSF